MFLKNCKTDHISIESSSFHTVRSKRIQPLRDISDPHVPQLRILSVLGQHFVAFDHRDQKTRSLFRNQIAANRSRTLPLSQGGGNAFLPGLEDGLQSLPELF